ncbi:hypothetical protein CQW23_19282 [Capsicum baccatum]|uniref:Uncharacterized protein n=1 Tax=Capsicum baccatum TaxID=33114 RepID=A0A2G2W5D2_CAPBA|nr:hypothetical protein CQW23_19282 [Capsicum baccatum]
MNGSKRSAEVVGCNNTSIEEHSTLEGILCASGGERSGSDNVGLSNVNIGENPMPRKPKGSSTRVKRGRENASSQCSNTRHYGAEVTHAILQGRARTTLSKRVKEVGDLMTVDPVIEAPVNGGRNYNGPKVEGEEGLLPAGPEPSVRYHSGRARILTLCQDLWAKGQSHVESFYGA